SRGNASTSCRKPRRHRDAAPRAIASSARALAGGFEAEPATVDVGELAQRDAGDLAVAAEGEGGEARLAEERIDLWLRRDERVAAARHQLHLQLLRPRDQPELLAIGLPRAGRRRPDW